MGHLVAGEEPDRRQRQYHTTDEQQADAQIEGARLLRGSRRRHFAPEESPHGGMRGRVAEYAWIAFRDHAASIRISCAVQHDTAVGDCQDRRQLVRYHDECRAEILAEIKNEAIEVRRGDRIEPGGGLVEQQQRWISICNGTK